MAELSRRHQTSVATCQALPSATVSLRHCSPNGNDLFEQIALIPIALSATAMGALTLKRLLSDFG
jgi:hypothetical protein